ncbi:PE/PPE C-terminal domain-containing protein [Mycobacterium haemophilum]
MTTNYEFGDLDPLGDLDGYEAAAQAASLESEYPISADDMRADFWDTTDWTGLDGPVAAGLGEAASVGRLSVPQSWETTHQATVGTPPSWPMGYLAAKAQTEEGQMLYGMPVENTAEMPHNPYDL